MNFLRQMLSKRAIRATLIVVLLLAVAYAGYNFYQSDQAEQASGSVNEVTQTSQAYIGSITLLASGTGVIVPFQEANLSFSEDGTIISVDVSLGQNVAVGDVLAQIETDKSEADLVLEIALAEQTVAEAQSTFEDAEYDYYSSTGAASQADIDELYAELIIARNSLERAQENYERVSNRAADDLRRAELQSALSGAQANYDTKVANYNAAISPSSTTDQALTEAALNVAQANLAAAQIEFEEAQANGLYEELISPISGFVSAINFTVGENVGTEATAITIANMDTVELEIYLDETDLENVSIGNAIEASFDAYPGQIFTGTVIGVDPSLQSIQNVTAVVAWVALDPGQDLPNFPINMQASVDVIAASAENTVLIPIEALREIDTNEYIVFVVGEDGEPRVRPVTVGLEDYTVVEILSGVEAGETVTTGLVQTQ